jgi:hypothetical protein
MTKTFNTPEDLYKVFEEYRDFVKTNPKLIQKLAYTQVVSIEHELPLTLQGFEAFVGADLSRYLSATKGTIYEHYGIVARNIKTQVKADQLQGAIVGYFNANIVSRLTGMHAKVEAEIMRTRIDIENESRRKGMNFTSPEIIFIKTNE